MVCSAFRIDTFSTVYIKNNSNNKYKCKKYTVRTRNTEDFPHLCVHKWGICTISVNKRIFNYILSP